jgi:tetratricopeptide (TPR) repeat protein
MQRAIRALPILLFLLFAFLFNTNLLTVRVSELNYLLEDASGTQEVLDNSAILGRFELLKRRLEQGESRVENYELEARIQALTAPRRPLASDVPAAIAPLVRPLRAFLNGLRYMLGKGAIHPESEDATLGALEVAYLRERSRSYRQALGIYLRVLPEVPLGSDLRATALLHVAFCDSMLNSLGNARMILTDVIAENPGKEQSAVAWKLLDFLDLLEQKRSAGLPGKPTDLDRARQAYLLVDYSTSISLLTGFIVRHKDDPRLAEAFYFRGRSHEELGELPPAIEDYRTVVSLSSAGPWTREAQRRLFLLATIYGQGEMIARDALGGSARRSEAAFVSAVTPYARIIDPSAVAAWLTGSADIARAPTSPVAVPAVSAAAAPDVLPDGSLELARVPSPTLPSKPTPEPQPESAAAPLTAPVVASTGDLFLPPLRLTPNTEHDEVPVLGPALPVGSAAALLAERSVLEQRHQREIGLRRGYNVGSWVSLGAGVASTGTMAYFLYQAFASYAQYQAATSAGQAQAMKEQTQFNSAVAITAGVAGGLALATALTLQLIAPPTAPTEDRIRRLDEAIDQLAHTSR